MFKEVIFARLAVKYTYPIFLIDDDDP